MSEAGTDAPSVVAKKIATLERLAAKHRFLTEQAPSYADAVSLRHQNGQSARQLIDQLRKDAGALDELASQLSDELATLTELLNAATRYD